MTNDITAIQGYLEKYSKTLIGQTLNGLDIFKDLDVNGGVIRNLTEKRSMAKMTVGDGVRPLNTAVETEKHNRVWTKRSIDPRFGMKIFKVIPDELRNTFMSEMLQPGAKEVPFAAWVWMKEFEKMGQELNDNFYLSSYHNDPSDWASGTVYNAGDLVYFSNIVYKANATTIAGESPTTTPAKWDDVDNAVVFDGPGTIIASEITGGLTPVATGVFDETSAYAKFIQVWDTIPEAVKNKRPVAYVSYGVAEDLITNHNTLFGSGKGIKDADIDVAGEFVLKGTANRLRVKPVTWMGSSRRIVTTLPGNIVIGTNQVGDFNGLKNSVPSLHGYLAVAKFALSSQIRDLEVLYVNDQA